MPWWDRLGELFVAAARDDVPMPEARTAPPVEPDIEQIAAEYATPHFKWSELECKGDCAGCSYAIDAGGPVRYIQVEALARLEALRVELNQPLIVNSAARCPRHNASVGGAPRSQHRSTEDSPSTAFDIRLTLPKEELIAAAERCGFKGIGANYKTFVHIDNRSRRARW